MDGKVQIGRGPELRTARRSGTRSICGGSGGCGVSPCVEGSGDIERASVLLREAEALWRVSRLLSSPILGPGHRQALAEDLPQVKERRSSSNSTLAITPTCGELYELITHDPDPEPYAGQPCSPPSQRP